MWLKFYLPGKSLEFFNIGYGFEVGGGIVWKICMCRAVCAGAERVKVRAQNRICTGSGKIGFSFIPSSNYGRYGRNG